MMYSLLLISCVIAVAQSFLATSAFRLANAIVSFRCNESGGGSSIGSSRTLNQRGYYQIRLMAFQQQLGTFEELILCDESVTVRNDRRVRYFDLTNASTLSVPITINNSNNTVLLPQPGMLVEYNTAWELQKHLLQSHIDRLSTVTVGVITGNSDNYCAELPSTFSSSFLPLDVNNDVMTNRIGADTIILVEHEPVYTLGTGSDISFILESQKSNQFVPPIVRIDRGGEVTYHGPGQLTVYPIIDLRNYNQDIHWYMRALEEVVVRAINNVLINDGQSTLVAHREENITGVWINDYKVAAIGVKCRKWITQHGFAINITPESMQYLDNIVPCGLLGRKVGYVNQFLHQKPITVSQMTEHIIQALGDVFQIRLVP